MGYKLGHKTYRAGSASEATDLAVDKEPAGNVMWQAKHSLCETAHGVGMQMHRRQQRQWPVRAANAYQQLTAWA
jgi:hypothetical protein